MSHTIEFVFMSSDARVDVSVSAARMGFSRRSVAVAVLNINDMNVVVFQGQLLVWVSQDAVSQLRALTRFMSDCMLCWAVGMG